MTVVHPTGRLQPPARRRWFRFRLVTALAIVTVLCGLLGYETYQARKHQRIAVAVQKADGFVAYRHRFSEQPWFDDHGMQQLGRSSNPSIQPDLPAPQWLMQLAGEGYFVRPGVVLLADPAAGRRLLPEICELSELLQLDVNGVADDNVRLLTRLSNLRRLELAGPMTDASIPALGSMTQLRYLDVAHAEISRDGVERLRTMLPDCEVVGWFDSPHDVPERQPAIRQ